MRAKLILGLVLVGFVGYVVYSTLGLAQVTCELCMRYNGLRDCATASGTNELEARNTAVTAACANISSGVTDSIACSNTPPESVTCTGN